MTEFVTGVDLVHLQLHVAAGGKLEELLAGKRPAAARALDRGAHLRRVRRSRATCRRRASYELVREAEGPGIRVDSGVYPGWEVPPFYDSMLAKLVVWAPDRETACRRLSQALHDTVYLGIPTNVDFLQRIVDDEAFRTANISTDMLAQRPELAAGPEGPPDDHALAAAVLCQALGKSNGAGGASPSSGGASGAAAGSIAPWQELGASDCSRRLDEAHP